MGQSCFASSFPRVRFWLSLPGNLGALLRWRPARLPIGWGREFEKLGQPSFMVEHDLRAGRLVEVLPEFAAAEIAIHAIYPSHRHLSIRVRLFLDGLKRHLAGSDEH